MNARLLKKLQRVFEKHNSYRELYGVMYRDPPHHIIHLWSPQNFGKVRPKVMKILQQGVKAGLVRREKGREEAIWGKNERSYILIPAETAYRLGIHENEKEK